MHCTLGNGTLAFCGGDGPVTSDPRLVDCDECMTIARKAFMPTGNNREHLGCTRGGKYQAQVLMRSPVMEYMILTNRRACTEHRIAMAVADLLSDEHWNEIVTIATAKGEPAPQRELSRVVWDVFQP